MERKVMHIAWTTCMELSEIAMERPLQKHEIILHAQACRTLTKILKLQEDMLDAEEQVNESQ